MGPESFIYIFRPYYKQIDTIDDSSLHYMRRSLMGSTVGRFAQQRSQGKQEMNQNFQLSPLRQLPGVQVKSKSPR